MSKLYQYYRAFRGLFYYIPPIRAAYNFLVNEPPRRKGRKLLKKYGVQDLNVVTQATNDAGIKAFCEYGTLLGIIREQRFLPHDEDMDMGILETPDFSWERLDRALEKKGLKKLHAFSYEGRITEQSYSFADGLKVDFFLFRKDGDTMRTYLYFQEHGVSYPSKRDFSVKANIYPHISGLKNVSFEGYEIRIPENPEKHLEDIYGSGWKTPDPSYQPDRTRHIMPNFGRQLKAQ